MAMLRIETGPAMDAVALLAHAYEALRTRHGDRFRSLDRRIEDLADRPETIASFETLNDGTAVLAAAPEVARLLADARHLGVIR